MSIRARLNNKNTHTFDYDNEQWLNLKKNHKKFDLVMPCCNSHAVPKTSKLNTKFFAHSKKGECSTAPESSEHIYLKTLISEIAIENDWEVTTEKQGKTPSGEVWIADVYCTKGSSKLAFEVQWSTQTSAEFTRRTKKYTESDVRVLWLYRVKSNKTYRIMESIPYDSLTPVFVFKEQPELKESSMLQFNVTIKDFISGAFKGHLKWLPLPAEKTTVKIKPKLINCWKCKKQIKVIDSLDISRPSSINIEDLDIILRFISNQKLKKLGIGTIKRDRKTAECSTLLNSCYHCNTFFSSSYKSITLNYTHSFTLHKDWYLKGCRSQNP